jgi:hypothetical protein
MKRLPPWLFDWELAREHRWGARLFNFVAYTGVAAFLGALAGQFAQHVAFTLVVCAAVGLGATLALEPILSARTARRAARHWPFPQRALAVAAVFLIGALVGWIAGSAFAAGVAVLLGILIALVYEHAGPWRN